LKAKEERAKREKGTIGARPKGERKGRGDEQGTIVDKNEWELADWALKTKNARRKRRA